MKNNWHLEKNDLIDVCLFISFDERGFDIFCCPQLIKEQQLITLHQFVNGQT